MKTSKHISMLCLYGMLSLVMHAQNSNNLVVFSETGERFYLVLNGLKYNQNPETNVKVTNLNATNYKAKIIFESGKPDLNHNVFLTWEGNPVTNKEFTYAVAKKGEAYKLKFISQADIGASANSNSVIFNADGSMVGGSSVNTANTTVVNNGVNTGGNGAYNSSTTITTTSTTGTNGVGMNVNMDGMNMSVNVNGVPNGTVNGTQVTTTTTTTTTSYSSSSSSSYSGNTQAYNTGSTTTGGCMSPMSDASFSDLVQSINAKSFEDAKMTVAKQAVASNCVSAAQVRKLMDLFSFEDNKLALTKYTYAYTWDKQNYFKVNDGFSFDSSVDALNNYISSMK